MTVCIAVCLRDGIFLMTDGREVIQSTNEILSDDAIKMSHVSKNVVCAHFGMSLPVNDALKALDKTALDTALDTKIIQNQFSRASMIGLAPILGKITGSRDSILALRFGFLYGGLLANDRPYIGGFLWLPSGPPSEMINITPGSCSTLGGNDHATRSIFIKKMRNLPSDGKTPRISSCIEAGIHTIRKVEKNFPNVGGKVRYSVLRKGFTPQINIMI